MRYAAVEGGLFSQQHVDTLLNLTDQSDGVMTHALMNLLIEAGYVTKEASTGDTQDTPIEAEQHSFKDLVQDIISEGKPKFVRYMEALYKIDPEKRVIELLQVSGQGQVKTHATTLLELVGLAGSVKFAGQISPEVSAAIYK